MWPTSSTQGCPTLPPSSLSVPIQPVREALFWVPSCLPTLDKMCLSLTDLSTWVWTAISLAPSWTSHYLLSFSPLPSYPRHTHTHMTVSLLDPFPRWCNTWLTSRTSENKPCRSHTLSSVLPCSLQLLCAPPSLKNSKGGHDPRAKSQRVFLVIIVLDLSAESTSSTSKRLFLHDQIMLIVVQFISAHYFLP